MEMDAQLDVLEWQLLGNADTIQLNLLKVIVFKLVEIMWLTRVRTNNVMMKIQILMMDAIIALNNNIGIVISSLIIALPYVEMASRLDPKDVMMDYMMKKDVSPIAQVL